MTKGFSPIFCLNFNHILCIFNMENYTKGRNVEEHLDRDSIPIPGLPKDFLWMQVHGGSKMRNLLSHASGVLEDKTTQTVVWSGAGAGLPKAVSCAEILKRQFKIEHQITRICYKKVEEFWEPKLEGLERIVVNRQVPVIHILLSIDPVDVTQTGYQSKSGKKFWQGVQVKDNKSQNYSARHRKHQQKSKD